MNEDVKVLVIMALDAGLLDGLTLGLVVAFLFGAVDG